MLSRQELCEQVIARTPDAVIVADREGRIRLWNAGAEAMFGYRAKEAIGQRLELIIPEQLQRRSWAAYGRAMATGERQYSQEGLTVPAIRRDGMPMALEVSLALLRDEGGMVTGVAAILRDVTKRWQQGETLKV